MSVTDIHMHDNESKCMLHGEDGKLYYQDLEKGVVVN